MCNFLNLLIYSIHFNAYLITSLRSNLYIIQSFLSLNLFAQNKYGFCKSDTKRLMNFEIVQVFLSILIIKIVLNLKFYVDLESKWRYSVEFSIKRDTVTIENHLEPTPVITTKAAAVKTEFQIVETPIDTDILDKMKIEDTMAVHEYTLTGTLADKESGDSVS